MADMHALALSVNQLSVRRGERNILSDITMSVECGSFLGVVGENGSGKTTLLRTLSGLVPFSQGEVLLFGHSIKKMPRRDIAQNISFLPQKISPTLPLTVNDLVIMGRYIHASSSYGYSLSDYSAVREVLELLGIESLGERVFSELSGGEQQKVLIACSLVQGAQILILDEPDSFLDQRQKTILFETLVTVQKQRGVSLIVASHDLSRISKYASNMILIQGGMLGTFEEALQWR